jgi:hypothetical protein
MCSLTSVRMSSKLFCPCRWSLTTLFSSETSEWDVFNMNQVKKTLNVFEVSWRKKKSTSQHYRKSPESVKWSTSHRDSHPISMVKPPDRETKKCKSVPDNQRSHRELLIKIHLYSPLIEKTFQ